MVTDGAQAIYVLHTGMRLACKCRRVGNIKWIRNTEQEKSKMILNSTPRGTQGIFNTFIHLCEGGKNPCEPMVYTR